MNVWIRKPESPCRSKSTRDSEKEVRPGPSQRAKKIIPIHTEIRRGGILPLPESTRLTQGLPKDGDSGTSSEYPNKSEENYTIRSICKNWSKRRSCLVWATQCVLRPIVQDDCLSLSSG